MASIYQKAENVLIWLGEEDFASNNAISFVRKLAAREFFWSSDKWWESYELMALSQLLGRPWFRRRWILQEAAFSAGSLVVYGDQDVSLDVLIKTLNHLRLT